MPSSPLCATRAPSAPKSSRNVGLLLANVCIYSIFVGWTCAILPCTLLIAALHWLWPKAMCNANRRYIWFYGYMTLWLLRPWLQVHMRNADLALRCPRAIIVCNHQSFLDIYLLAAQRQSNVCLVTKSWPFRLLFFFAPAMRSAGYIDAESLPPEEVERRCLQRLDEGATLVVYPEGRRTRDGRLGRFHSGAFHVAVHAGVPVLPLLIHNSFQVFPPGGRLFRPAAIAMEFLEPVCPELFAAELLPHRAMMRRTHALFLCNLQPDTEEIPS